MTEGIGDPQVADSDLTPELEQLIRGQFSDVDRLIEFGDILLTQGMLRGLIGPREAPRLWQRHLLNCVAVSELIPQASRVVDLGSGAGLPGIALACVRRDLTVQLVEPLLRRTSFLAEVIVQLGVTDNVEVIRGRAADASVVQRVGNAPFATVRAVAPLSTLAGWAAPLLSRGGQLLAIKGAAAESELTDLCDRFQELPFDVVGIAVVGTKYLRDPARVVQLTRR